MILVMKVKDIKNGSIYYNTQNNRPERVISNTFSSTRVVTEFHGKNQNAVYSKYLRLANSKEVGTYLEKKNFIKSFFKKLFNQKK
tara:strand:+ start:1275 stop:1529 length:255 start_codon:yes stop_codon:yes gene_type:complete